MTHDGRRLIMSDGTSTLHFLDPESLEALDKLIVAEHKTVITLDSDIHGIIYRNVDGVQEKICASVLESV